MIDPSMYQAATMLEERKSQNKHPRLLRNRYGLVTRCDNATLRFLLGLGPLAPQGIPRLRFEDFPQTFPAMLLRLVGTADTAGDCEKNRRWRDSTARRRHGYLDT